MKSIRGHSENPYPGEGEAKICMSVQKEKADQNYTSFLKK